MESQTKSLTAVQKALLVFLTDPTLRSSIRSADPMAYQQAVRAAEVEGIACSEHAREPNGLSCTRCGKPSLIHGGTRRYSEIAIYQAQAREDARADAEGREPRLIKTMDDITDGEGLS